MGQFCGSCEAQCCAGAAAAPAASAGETLLQTTINHLDGLLVSPHQRDGLPTSTPAAGCAGLFQKRCWVNGSLGSAEDHCSMRRRLVGPDLSEHSVVWHKI